MRKCFSAAAVMATFAAFCFAETATAESRRIIELPGDKCPGYIKASAQTFAMALGDWSCDSRAELEAHEQLMKYANDPSCYSQGWYNDESRRFWQNYDKEQRKKIMDDSLKACNRLKGDTRTAARTFTLKSSDEKYEYTFRFDIPVQYDPDSDDPRHYKKRFSKGADQIVFGLHSTRLESDNLYTGSPPGPRGFLGENVAWRSGGAQEYILFARSCNDSCTLEIRIDGDLSVSESLKKSLLDGSYLQASSNESGRQYQESNRTAVAEGHWFVIAGAWPSTENSKLKARMSLLSSNSITAHVIKTDEYSNLTPGLRAVVLGPTSKEQAQTQLDAVKSIVPDAFIKEGF